MQRNPHSYQIATGYRTFYSLSLIYQPITKKTIVFLKSKAGTVDCSGFTYIRLMNYYFFTEEGV